MAAFLNKITRLLLEKFWNGGCARTVQVKRQSIYSLVFRGLSLLVSFILVRRALVYLNEYEYGLWITLSSILAWINSCDIGLGNGLRNKLSESFARNDVEAARCYITTAFAAVALIASIILGVYSLISPFVDWNRVLNTVAPIPRLNITIWGLFVFFILNFVLRLTISVYVAKLKTSVVQIVHLLEVGFALVCIETLIFIKAAGSFEEVGFLYCGSTLLVYLVAYPIAFGVSYPELRPSIRFFRKNMLKGLLQLSWQFFFIQIATVVFFLATNLIIAQLFNPAIVTPYNLAAKYYSAVYMTAVVIIAPIWPAATNAYVQHDFCWLRRSYKKNLQLFCVFVLGYAVMFVVSPYFFKLWLGNDTRIPLDISFVTAIQHIILTYAAVICYYINGIGKIQIQLLGYWISVVLYPFLGWVLGNSLGVVGIIMANSILLALLSIVLTIQFYRIISDEDIG